MLIVLLLLSGLMLSSASGPGAAFSHSLLLVAGDHGQGLRGDHGGGSREETQTVMMAFDVGR